MGQIVEKLGLSQPTVSKHLKVLRDIGLVRVREGGQHRYYSIDSSRMEEVEDWLIPFLRLGCRRRGRGGTGRSKTRAPPSIAPWAGCTAARRRSGGGRGTAAAGR